MSNGIGGPARDTHRAKRICDNVSKILIGHFEDNFHGSGLIIAKEFSTGVEEVIF
jgi:hypothetical protein